MKRVCSVCGKTITDTERPIEIDGEVRPNPLYGSWSEIVFPDGVLFKVLCEDCEKAEPTVNKHWAQTKADYASELPSHGVVPP